MKETGLRIRRKAQVAKNGPMEVCMKGNTRRERLTERESLLIQMALCIRASSKQGNSMARAHVSGQMVGSTLDIGLTVRSRVPGR